MGLQLGQLAERLGVRPPSVTELERNEAEERITLATLRRAAEALDCTLVYAIVPNKPLEAMVQDAAAAAAAARCELNAVLSHDQSRRSGAAQARS